VQGHAHLGGWGGEGEATPGSWSTAATPGTAQPSDEWGRVSPTGAVKGVMSGHKPRSGSGSSTGSMGGGGILKKAWVSEELEPHAPNQYYPLQGGGGTSFDTPDSIKTNSSDGSRKFVHFTSSVVDGSSSDGATISQVQDYPSAVADWLEDPSTHASYGSLPAQPPSQGSALVDVTALPPGFVPESRHSSDWAAGVPPPPFISPPSPPHQPSNAHYPSPQYTQPHHISAPQPVHGQPVHTLYASAPPMEFELSPSVIAKAQKHCRFAISALDYEDAAQARKELRAALAVLGG